MKQKNYAFFILTLFLYVCCITNSINAQTTAKLSVTFSTPRNAGNGLVSIDLLVSAGTNYITNNAEFNGGNANGSWEAMNLRFTSTSAIMATDIKIAYPTGIQGSTVSNIPAGGCYAEHNAFGLSIRRNPPTPDAGPAAMVLATLTYPANLDGNFTVRGFTKATCGMRESSWTNSNSVNAGIRLALQSP